ncbi:MAG: tetratricopeptide repeat protein, partial [Elusimicrobiota bacterium]
GAPVSNSWPLYSLRGVYDGKYYDYRSRALVPIYPFFAAIHEPAKKYTHRIYALARWGDCLWRESNVKMDFLREAFAEYSAGRFAAAESLYKQVIRLFPEELSAFTNLGVMEKERGNPEKAKQYYYEALKIDPRYADGYYNLSVIFWEQNKWDEVVNNLRRVLEINPEDPRAKHYLPLAESKMKQ